MGRWKARPKVYGQILLLLSVLAMSSVSLAAERYVRAGATGNGSGSDWTNACTGFSGSCAPSSLVRGDTYYVADGSYGGGTFNTAVSGTQLITIKKATIADHGTDVGWQNSFGDGQALFTGTLTFTTDYWVVDGVTRNESNWADIASYGFRLKAADGADSIAPTAHNLTFKYIDIGDDLGTLYPTGMPATALKAVGTDGNQFGPITLHRAHVHNVITPFHTRNTKEVTIEYVYVQQTFGKEVISQQKGNDWIVRHFIWRDCGITAEESQTAEIGVFNFTGGGSPDNVLADRWQVYDGIIEDTGTFDIRHADGVILAGNVHDWKVYNLTLVNLGKNRNDIIISGTGNQVYNIIFAPVGLYTDGLSAATVNVSGTPGPRASHIWCQQHPLGHRAGTDCNRLAGLYEGSISNGNDPYVDRAKHNFRLNPNALGTLPINNGKTLDAGFDPIDLDGNKRGVGGAWDMGAYEFVGGSTAQPNPPTSLTVQ